MSIRDRYEQIYHEQAAMSGAQGGLHLGGARRPVKRAVRKPKGGCEMCGGAVKGSKCRKGPQYRAMFPYHPHHEEAERCIKFTKSMARKDRRPVKKPKGGLAIQGGLAIGGQALSNDFFLGEGRKKRQASVKQLEAAARNPWIMFLEAYAADNGITYNEALRTKGIGAVYRKSRFYKGNKPKRVRKVAGVNYH